MKTKLLLLVLICLISGCVNNKSFREWCYDGVNLRVCNEN